MINRKATPQLSIISQKALRLVMFIYCYDVQLMFEAIPPIN